MAVGLGFGGCCCYEEVVVKIKVNVCNVCQDQKMWPL